MEPPFLTGNPAPPHSAQVTIADTFTYAEVVTQAQAIPYTNTTEPMNQAATSAYTDQAAATKATPKKVNMGKKTKAKHEALQPLKNILPLNNINNTNSSEQTTNMGTSTNLRRGIRKCTSSNGDPQNTGPDV